MNDPSVGEVDRFNMLEGAPMPWFNKSSDLRASAGALWMAMGNNCLAQQLSLGEGFDMSAVWPVYLLLCGMSLELLYKAIWVAERKKPEQIHKLIDLVKAAGLPMKPSSEDTLTLLTGCVEWWGRYPVPKGKKSFHDFHTLYKKVMYTTNKFRGFDILKATDALSWESFNELWTEAQVQFFRKYQL